jgi:hypothetical protein
MIEGDTNERPVGELFAELASETGALVQHEVRLAAVEMTAKAVEAAKDASLVGVGGAVAYAGFLGLLAALVLGLGTLMPIWIAALAVGMVVTLTGYSVAMKGMAAIKKIDPMPKRTARTLEENRLWVKEQLSR